MVTYKDVCRNETSSYTNDFCFAAIRYIVLFITTVCVGGKGVFTISAIGFYSGATTRRNLDFF